MSDPSVEDVLWLAGYLEGEGCFSIVNGGTPSARITVSTTDLDVAIKVAKLLECTSVGTYSRKTAKQRPVYVTCLGGVEAITWMIRVYPFLGERRKSKILECINGWYLLKNARSKRKAPKAIGEGSKRLWINEDLIKEARIV